MKRYELKPHEMIAMTSNEQLMELLQSKGFDTTKEMQSIRDPITGTYLICQMDNMQSLMYRQDLERISMQSNDSSIH